MHYEKTITAEIQLDCALLRGKQAVTTSNVHNSGKTKEEVAGNLSDAPSLSHITYLSSLWQFLSLLLCPQPPPPSKPVVQMQMHTPPLAIIFKSNWL